MFTQCDYILGENGSIVIVVPTRLPKSAPLTIEVGKGVITFKSGDEDLANIVCDKPEVIQRLADKLQVGLIEFEDGSPKFPAYISAVADVMYLENAA